jgi:hypothetical protein
MRIRWTTRIMTAAGVLTLIAGIAANGGPANASSSKPASTVRPYTTRYVTGGALQGVAAVARSAWAVGYTGTPAKPKTLIVAWNGRTWAKAPGFTPVTGELSGISAVSATSAWAVGFAGSPAAPRTLLLHWNGQTWAAVTTPAPVGGTLAAVTATAAYAWLDGSTRAGAALIWHWNGKAWAQSPTAGAPGHVTLLGVAAHSGGSAWAVGASAKGTGPRGIAGFWNGAAWVKTPAPATGSLTAAAAGGGSGGGGGGGNAWAVGTNITAVAFSTLITRWTGKEWARVASPTPTGYGSLTAVAATSTDSAWAVGSTGLSDSKTLILHWNGKAWS